MKVEGQIVLKKGKEHSIERNHPWIFSGAIQKMTGSIVDGCGVEVFRSDNKLLGYGHYQNGSIAVRMLSFGSEELTEAFWVEKIRKASLLRLRAGLPSTTTNAFRLVHAEGDGLPGLIIDYYEGAAVIQAHSSGMHLDRKEISEALQTVFGQNLKAVYYKRHAASPSKLGADGQQEEYLYGMGAVPHIINEYGLKFYVDWEEGQKTGFFLDQRENRKLVGELARDKKVLNTFCYTGGFSVYGLQGGATLVHSVDSSQRAIDLTKKNIALNGFDPAVHQCFAIDTFEFFKDKQDLYDVIILDPPAFAKHRDARHQAIKGYQRLNTEAMRVINKGGIIFTFSCSQVVDRQVFYDTIVSAAIQAGRQIKVLQHLSQPADHPVSIFHPEGEYLKGLVLYVE